MCIRSLRAIDSSCTSALPVAAACLAQEPNFHTLYLALLDKLGDSKLGASLVATTHKYIRILLASGRIKTHTSERSLLKNLGTW